MSWLARSLANSLRPDHRDGDEADDDEGEVRRIGEKGSDEAEGGESSPIEEPGSPGRGVKEDLSELTKTLTRQFWGVASFLAPPPPNVSSSSSKDSDELEVPESPRIGGIRSDFAEIGGRFRTGISRLSSNKAVSEISKIASTFLPFGSEEEEYDEEEEEDEEYEEKYDARAIGVTDEVLAFARNISMHPETWLDFPLFHEDEDSDDFDVSDAQQEHALAVERLAPRLAALRIELCPSHMSEGCFWKIYFVLLHSRLNRNDAELLSTPQVVEARTIWLQELQKRTKPESERYIRGASYGKEAVTSFQPEEQVRTPLNIPYETGPPKVVAFDERNDIPMTDFVSEKHAILSSELKMIDKSVIEEEPLVQVKNKDLPVDASEISIQRYEEEGDDWLEEETGEMGGSGNGSVPFGNEEDVSFSDLEEDDDQSAPTSSKTVNRTTNSQTKDSRGWVQLNKSSGDSAKAGNTTSPDIKESNDWLNVDDIDVV